MSKAPNSPRTAAAKGWFGLQRISERIQGIRSTVQRRPSPPKLSPGTIKRRKHDAVVTAYTAAQRTRKPYRKSQRRSMRKYSTKHIVHRSTHRSTRRSTRH